VASSLDIEEGEEPVEEVVSAEEINDEIVINTLADFVSEQWKNKTPDIYMARMALNQI